MKRLLNINMLIAMFVSAWLVGNVLCNKNEKQCGEVSCMKCKKKSPSTLICKPSTCPRNKGSVKQTSRCSNVNTCKPKIKKIECSDNFNRKNKCTGPSCQAIKRQNLQPDTLKKTPTGDSHVLDQNEDKRVRNKVDDKHVVRGSSTKFNTEMTAAKKDSIQTEGAAINTIEQELTKTKTSKEEFSDTEYSMQKAVKVEFSDTDTADVLQNAANVEFTDGDRLGDIDCQEECTDTVDLIRNTVVSTSTGEFPEDSKSEINPNSDGGSNDENSSGLLSSITESILSFVYIVKSSISDAEVEKSHSIDSMTCAKCLNEETTETTESQPALIKSSMEKVYELARNALSPSTSQSDKAKSDIDIRSSQTDATKKLLRDSETDTMLDSLSSKRQRSDSPTCKTCSPIRGSESPGRKYSTTVDSTMSQTSNSILCKTCSATTGTETPDKTSIGSKSSLEHVYDFVQNKLAGKRSQEKVKSDHIESTLYKPWCNVVTCGTCEANTCPSTGHNFCAWKKCFIRTVVVIYKELASTLKDMANGITDGVYGISSNRCNLFTCGCRETKTCAISKNNNHGYCMWKKCFTDTVMEVFRGDTNALKCKVNAIAGGIKGYLDWFKTSISSQ